MIRKTAFFMPENKDALTPLTKLENKTFSLKSALRHR